MYQDEAFEPDPFLLWRPKASGDHSSGFNSKGYRGREFSEEKTDGEFRVLTLGDSNTLGPRRYSWAGFLQQVLDEAFAGVKATVINGGVHGYTSLQGLRRFQEALQYEPNVVVAAFGWNDAVETTNRPDQSYGQDPVRTMQIRKILATHFRIYHLVRHLSRKYGLYSHPAETLGTRLYPRVSLQDYENNLTGIATTAREHAILAILLTRPNIIHTRTYTFRANQWRHKLAAYNDIVRKVAHEQDVPLVDAYAFFKDRPEEFVDDNHLKEAGAQVLARNVFSAIQAHLSRLPCRANK